jgi:hypothetical protein
MNFIAFESEQKLRGGFYTDPAIAAFLVDWVFKKNGTQIGEQRTPMANTYHCVLTTWKKALDTGNFQKDENTKKSGVLVKKAEALPTLYLEIAELSIRLIGNNPVQSDSDIIEILWRGCKQLGDAKEFVYRGLGPSGWSWRGIDRFLTEKNGACQEWAFFLQALIEFQGVDVKTMGFNVPPDKVLEFWRYATQKEAVGGIPPNSDPMEPDAPKYWKFLNHQFVITKGDIYSATVFNPVFNIISDFIHYEDTVFPKLGLMIEENKWKYYDKPIGLYSKTPLDEWE